MQNDLLKTALGVSVKAAHCSTAFADRVNAARWPWTRIYCRQELNLLIKPWKHQSRDKPDVVDVRVAPNHTWPMDFMANQLVGGRSYRALYVLASATRERPGVKVDFSLLAERVVHNLNRII